MTEAGGVKERRMEQSELDRLAKGEFTAAPILLGVVIAVIMTAANVYLGLYAGMTVSASIPSAVIAMAVFRALRRNNILASNIVQTLASSGESLAAGVIFTVPALVLVGAWTDFRFWPTTLIAISGGLLGVIFMIPLRRALIVEERELTYPEGVACATVLRAGSDARARGVGDILRGIGLGALFKAAGTGLGLIRGSVEWAAEVGGRPFFLGSDISPALLAVGYIVRLEIAALVFVGGAIGWLVAIPLMAGPRDLVGASALDTAWALWTGRVRYLGVGAMVVGGIWSIISVRRGIRSGLANLRAAHRATGAASVPRTERDMSLGELGFLLALAIAVMLGLYDYLLGDARMTVLATVVMVAASFLVVAVSSYVTGLVGTSNNPVSGMTISALLGTAAFLLVVGYRGSSAILATLGVAAVVCCAACTAGDCSQDLKTGYLVGSTPRYQQYTEVIGVIVPAFVVAPVLSLLHASYGIGKGLKAPQATLFASIADGIFGEGHLPYDMVFAGMGLGVAVLAADAVLHARGARFRLHLMPLAVGIYLPFTLAVPILLGGIVRAVVERAAGHRPDSAAAAADDEGRDRGILLGSGLIAGEAIMGVILAVFIYVRIDLSLALYGSRIADVIGAMALAALAAYLLRTGLRSRSQ